MTKAKVTLRGTPEKQAAYTRNLLAVGDRKRFQFVVFFIPQDYDPLWNAIQTTAPELFMAWRDCGLLDEHGQAHPSNSIWREYFAQTLSEGRRKPISPESELKCDARCSVAKSPPNSATIGIAGFRKSAPVAKYIRCFDVIEHSRAMCPCRVAIVASPKKAM